LELINKAIEMRPQEKIFTTVNANILKMLNLQDAAESYEACRQNIQTRIVETNTLNEQNYNKIYERAKEIHEIEQRMIS
jgi:hypothetical protein